MRLIGILVFAVCQVASQYSDCVYPPSLNDTICGSHGQCGAERTCMCALDYGDRYCQTHWTQAAGLLIAISVFYLLAYTPLLVLSVWRLAVTFAAKRRLLLRPAARMDLSNTWSLVVAALLIGQSSLRTVFHLDPFNVWGLLSVNATIYMGIADTALLLVMANVFIRMFGSMLARVDPSYGRLVRVIDLNLLLYVLLTVLWMILSGVSSAAWVGTASNSTAAAEILGVIIGLSVYSLTVLQNALSGTRAQTDAEYREATQTLIKIIRAFQVLGVIAVADIVAQVIFAKPYRRVYWDVLAPQPSRLAELGGQWLALYLISRSTNTQIKPAPSIENPPAPSSRPTMDG